MFAVWTRFLQPEELLVVAEQRRVRSGASELADPAALTAHHLWENPKHPQEDRENKVQCPDVTPMFRVRLFLLQPDGAPAACRGRPR